MAKTTSHDDRGEQFARLLSAHQRRLYGFILTLVPSRHDADDLLQDASAVLWRKFDQYQPGSDFAAWAMRVARLAVFEWLRDRKRQPLPMGEALFDKIADAAAAMSDEYDARRDALRHCIAELDDRDRQLIAHRYHDDQPVREIAEQLGVTTQAIYKAMRRVHEALLACIRRTLAEGDQP